MLGQTEGGDVRPHESARFVLLFEDGDRVAERHEVVRDGQRCRSRADACDALADFLRWDFRKTVCDVIAQIGGNALQSANGDGLAIDALAAAGWLARAVAGAAKNAGKDIRLAIDHVGIGVEALRDHADILRHIRMRRARPLAIDNFMKIIRILLVGWLHGFLLV